MCINNIGEKNVKKQGMLLYRPNLHHMNDQDITYVLSIKKIMFTTSLGAVFDSTTFVFDSLSSCIKPSVRPK